MSADGINSRRIVRFLGVKSVMYWEKTHSNQLPPAPVLQDLNNAELDELFTYIERKKRRLLTIVDRRRSCIVAWGWQGERRQECLQQMVDDAPQGAFYFSDLFATYRNLIYPSAIHTPMPDKSETYRVEGMNAELRYYLARLARRSRCFSRSVQALRRAVKLFVFAWNRHQIYHQRYPAHLLQFVCS